MDTEKKKDTESKEVGPSTDIDIKQEYLDDVRENFKLTDDEEKLFSKLTSLRANIGGLFSMKFRIQAMKDVIEECEVIKFLSERAKLVDKNIPVFRIKMVVTKEFLDAEKASDDVQKVLLSGNSSALNIDKVTLEETIKFNTRIVSEKIFSKYLQKMMEQFENISDEKVKCHYDELKEIFDIIPKNVVDSYICGAIFHVRFFEDNLKTGQIEFVF